MNKTDITTAEHHEKIKVVPLHGWDSRNTGPDGQGRETTLPADYARAEGWSAGTLRRGGRRGSFHVFGRSAASRIHNALPQATRPTREPLPH